MRYPGLVQLTNLRRAFAHAEQGNVAVIFAIALIPLLGLVGMAIDYARASGAQATLQAAADSTALAMSKDAPNVTASALQTEADTYYRALITRKDLLNLTVTVNYTTNPNPRVVVTASANIKPRFLSMPPFNIGDVPVSVSSTTTWGMSRLRVALVLDNTGSMAQSGKLTALKTATKNLLSQLQSAATTNGDVYVSIVPFSKDVAVDPVNYTQTWIDWTDWDAANQVCSGRGRNSSCDPASHDTWNGCITDRGNSNGPSSGNYDTNVVAPTTTIPATLFPAEQDSNCTQAVMGLSYKWSDMTTVVNNMVANGNTNQAIGLAWGWLSLVGGGPFTAPPMDPNYQYQQVIILLTDGLNTQDRWYTSQNSIDARQKLTCNNIKAANITLYAIQVNTGGDPTSTLLQNCASNKPGTTDHFFLLTSANQIVTTFQTIGTNLSQLRIAK